MTIQQVRDGIVTRLATITGLTATARPPTTLNPPHAFISDMAVNAKEVFEGHVAAEVTVTVLVSLADDDAAWATISALLDDSSGSIVYALDADSDLANTIQYAVVERFENIGANEYAGVTYYGFTANIRVMA